MSDINNLVLLELSELGVVGALGAVGTGLVGAATVASKVTKPIPKVATAIRPAKNTATRAFKRADGSYGQRYSTKYESDES